MEEKVILEYNIGGFKYLLKGDKNLYLDEAVDCGFAPFYANFYTVTNKEYKVGTVKFSPFPGCSAIVVTTELSIELEYRGKGWGYAGTFQNIREQMAKKLGASKMLATIEMSNIPQLVSCIHHNWKIVNTFTSKSNGHLLALIEKEV
jgi:hypothetical protein